MQTATWANDALDAESSKGKSKPATDYLNFDSDSGQESEEEGAREDLKGKGCPCPRACPCQVRVPMCIGLCFRVLGPLRSGHRRGQIDTTL